MTKVKLISEMTETVIMDNFPDIFTAVRWAMAHGHARGTFRARYYNTVRG